MRGTIDPTEKVISVTTVGKESLTAAELYREDVVRQALESTPVAHPLIYYPDGTSWPPPVLNGFTRPPVFHHPYATPAAP
ncbi:hypothetical protein AZE42_11482 [Rhizopogon vesiculosus]|uniref:Uncharacterized protein n=1 Tax=Rhizopogon vesiculosus TaxID=180088 RepID=A0A1J8Q3P0_9AGAM|nr:hypothetical protein AZE42_11482 [Rhizopogon vesiculosus]